MFVNLTPHEIAVEVEVEVEVMDHGTVHLPNLTVINGRHFGPFALLRVPPEPVSARVSTVEEVVGLSNAGGLIVTVSRHTFGKIENLPEPQAGVVFIVSGMVRDALDGRDDVLAPDTGKSAVRQQGHVEFVTCLRTK